MRALPPVRASSVQAPGISRRPEPEAELGGLGESVTSASPNSSPAWTRGNSPTRGFSDPPFRNAWGPNGRGQLVRRVGVLYIRLVGVAEQCALCLHLLLAGPFHQSLSQSRRLC